MTNIQTNKHTVRQTDGGNKFITVKSNINVTRTNIKNENDVYGMGSEVYDLGESVDNDKKSLNTKL